MKGKRYSRQRELIFEALKASHEHPTAEMMYQWLKPENPNLSLGTVYRNLNLLADEGAIVRWRFRWSGMMPIPCLIPISGVPPAARYMIWACPMTGDWMNRRFCTAATTCMVMRSFFMGSVSAASGCIDLFSSLDREPKTADRTKI